MYYAVSHWNSYFNAFLYLNDSSLYPLQLVLRDILVMSQINASSITDPDLAYVLQGLADSLKYSLIVVSSIPVLLIYPFAQKYFVEGVMVGSIKG